MLKYELGSERRSRCIRAHWKSNCGCFTCPNWWPTMRACTGPTLRQIPSGLVLARSVVSSAWNRRKPWSKFAGQSGKAHLPLNERRQQEASLVKAHASKKPAANIKRPAAMRHCAKKPATHVLPQKVRRTPFNRVRVSTCRIMGKKRQGGLKA